MVLANMFQQETNTNEWNHILWSFEKKAIITIILCTAHQWKIWSQLMEENNNIQPMWGMFFFDRTIAWHNQITQICNVDLILWAERQKKNDWIMIYFKAEISSACLLASWSDNVQLKFNGCNWAMPADKIQQTKKFIRYVWNI